MTPLTAGRFPLTDRLLTSLRVRGAYFRCQQTGFPCEIIIQSDTPSKRYSHPLPANKIVQPILGDAFHRFHIVQGARPAQQKTSVFPASEARAKCGVPGVHLHHRRAENDNTAILFSSFFCWPSDNMCGTSSNADNSKNVFRQRKPIEGLTLLAP